MKHDVREREYDKFRPADNEKSKVAVVLEQEEAIPVFQTFGTIKNIFNESLTDPGMDVDVITYTVTEPKLRVMKASVSCFVEGKMTLLVNGNKVSTCRTAPGKPDAATVFTPFIELVSGDQLKATFKARTNSPVAEIEIFINACECI